MVTVNLKDRKLVRIAGRAYVWVSALNILLLDENMRVAYPFLTAGHRGLPGCFVVEMNGWLALKEDAQYEVWDVGPFERFDLDITKVQVNADYPRPAFYKLTMNGVYEAADRDGSGFTTVRIGIFAESTTGPGVTGGFVTRMSIDDFYSLSTGNPFPAGIVNLQNQTVAEVISASLQSMGVSDFVISDNYGPPLTPQE